jgi:hypothetical protein
VLAQEVLAQVLAAKNPLKIDKVVLFALSDFLVRSGRHKQFFLFLGLHKRYRH